MLRTEEWTLEYTVEVPEPRPEVEIEEGLPVAEGVGETPVQEFRPASLLQTLVVSVWEDEKVHVDNAYASEFGLDTDKAEEIVPEFQQRFVWAFPYDVFRARFEELGWEHASTKEA
jgi:hypothetical protein